MKILITGTHGTGKSTLLEALKQLPELQSFQFIGGVTRSIKEKGLQINEDGDWRTQLYCASIDIQNLLDNENKDVVYDRSVIDTYIYTKYLLSQNINNIYLTRVRDVTKILCTVLEVQFDLILWLRPEFKLEDDGVRSQSIDFQRGVDYLFLEFFKDFHLLNVYTVSGSVEERVKYIKRVIKRVKDERSRTRKNS
jgi:nicotinamide riboside kinase